VAVQASVERLLLAIVESKPAQPMPFMVRPMQCGSMILPTLSDTAPQAAQLLKMAPEQHAKHVARRAGFDYLRDWQGANPHLHLGTNVG
jgi:hypothetical protein